MATERLNLEKKFGNLMGKEYPVKFRLLIDAITYRFFGSLPTKFPLARLIRLVVASLRGKGPPMYRYKFVEPLLLLWICARASSKFSLNYNMEN